MSEESWKSIQIDNESKQLLSDFVRTDSSDFWRGITALKEVAFVNLSLLEGDHEHLNYISGTSSTCSYRNCRRCMSDRTFRFMAEDEKCKTG